MHNVPAQRGTIFLKFFFIEKKSGYPLNGGNMNSYCNTMIKKIPIINQNIDKGFQA